MAAKKICKGVWQVGGSPLTGGGDCLAYLVESGEGSAVLVDAGVGPGFAHILDNAMSAGFQPSGISHLVLTHCHIDHAGGAHRFKELVGGRIIAHSLDCDAIEGRRPELTAASWYGVDYAPVQVDLKLEPGDTQVDINGTKFTFLDTPGHTPGSVSVVVEKDGKKVLFAQDVHGPFQDDWGSSIPQWRESMRKLLALEADILCEGHFGVFVGKDEVRRFIEGYLGQY